MNLYACMLEKANSDEAKMFAWQAVLCMAMDNGDIPRHSDSNGDACAPPKAFIAFVEKFGLESHAKGYGKIKAALDRIDRQEQIRLVKCDRPTM